MKKFGLAGMVALVLLGAVAHGMWTHRFASGDGSAGGEAVLDRLKPAGGWVPGETVPVDPQQIAERTTTACRRFDNPKSGRSLTVSLTSGLPSIVAVHTPDVCYAGSGFTPRGPVRVEEIKLPNGKAMKCYVADFDKPASAGRESVRVRWAWADGPEGYDAPDSPRWKFARSAVLYKAYVVHALRPEDAAGEDPYASGVSELFGQLVPSS